jgi:hypothetical protein
MVRISTDVWENEIAPTVEPLSYSLSNPALSNLASTGSYEEPRYDDGLGHYWDSSIQGWRNNDGSIYDPSQSYAADPGLGVYAGQGEYNPAQSYTLGDERLGNLVSSGEYRQSDGLGHYWDSASGIWRNENDGSPYDPSYSAAQEQAAYPAFAPESWRNPVPEPEPETYGLGFGGSVFSNYGNAGTANPWDMNMNPQPEQGGGGFWGGVKDIAGTVGSGAVTALGAAREYVGSPIFGTLSGLSDAPQQPIYDDQGNIIGYKRDPGFLEYPRELGSALKRTVTDPVEQYSRARQGTDEYFANPENSPLWNAVGQTAIDPLSYFGPGLASKVVPEGMPAAGLIRGLIDQGGGAAVLGGNVGATAGASEAAESIPLFGDQPAWLRGLEGGLIGGIGAMGAAGTVKATAESAGESTFKRALGEAGEATTPGPGEIPGLNPIRRKVADALDEELKWRNSGEAEAIKTVKRAEQASGLNAVEAGATSAETLANVSAGAKVGKFFDNTPGLKLSETDYNAALTDLVNSTEGFDKIQAVKALDKLQNGTRLQPAEIKALGKLYGPEIEAKIRATNATRVSSIAELTPADQAQIAKQAEVDGRRVAILEAQAKRQHELADELTQRSLMNPTNKQLKTAAEDARARAIKAENDADRILAERAAAVEAKQNTKAFDAAQNAAKKESTKALRSDITRDFTESGQKAMADAEKAIDKLDVSPAMKQAQKDTVAIWLKQNERILDTLGEDGPGLLRRAYAAYTGEVTDSWTSALISRRRALETALESQGMSGEAARVIGKFVQDAEVKRRFGAEVPSWVTESLDQSKGVVRNDAGKAIRPREANIISAAADYSQEFKNTAFGIGDVAAFGQNGIHILNTNAVQFIAGLTNRLANMANIGWDTRAIGQDLIGKRAANALDSLSHSGATGIVDTSNGTLLRHIPGLSTVDRKLLTPAINTLTDIQFKHVLGWMRDVNFEGNLVLAKMAGADITDPAVRMRAAEWANAASGAGKLAQRANRANLEKASILSASMTRAQGQQLGQVARGLTAGSRVDRVLAAATIVSTVGTTLAIGKLLNDWVGTADFNFDPFSKPKPGQLRFGDIRLGDGTTINLFSQTQVPKVLAQSIGILAQDGFTKDDLTALGKAWGNFGMGRSSPALRLGEAAVGLGYEPSRGYRYGDYMEGKSLTDKVLSQLPIPPVVSQTFLQGERGKVLTPANIAGVNAFPESDYSQRDRQSMEMFGVPYAQQTPDQRVQFTDKNGKLPYANPQVQKALEAVTTAQQGADAELATGTFTPSKAQAWRDQYTTNKDNLRFFKDQVYADAGTKPGSDPQLDAYYKVIDQNTAQSGKVNWDAVDAYKKALPDGGKYIDTHSGFLQIDTPTTRAFESARDTIEGSGFFDKRDKAWKAIQAQLPEAKKYATYDEWYNAKLEAAQREWSGQATPEYIDKEARKIIDKMTPAQGMKEYGNIWENGWIQANPGAAYLAWKWGYFVPTEEQAKWINNAVGAR